MDGVNDVRSILDLKPKKRNYRQRTAARLKILKEYVQ